MCECFSFVVDELDDELLDVVGECWVGLDVFYLLVGVLDFVLALHFLLPLDLEVIVLVSLVKEVVLEIDGVVLFPAHLVEVVHVELPHERLVLGVAKIDRDDHLSHFLQILDDDLSLVVVPGDYQRVVLHHLQEFLDELCGLLYFDHPCFKNY